MGWTKWKDILNFKFFSQYRKQLLTYTKIDINISIIAEFLITESRGYMCATQKHLVNIDDFCM